MQHYVAAILAALEATPDAPRIRRREGVLRGAQIARAVRHSSAALRAAGVTAGSTVGVLVTPNHPLTLVVRYAAHLLGATVVHLRSVNPGTDVPLDPATQAAILTECGAAFLVTDQESATRAEAVQPLLDRPLRLVVLDLDAAVGIAAAGPVADGTEPDHSEAPAVAPTCAVVTYTSGSTGRPKGVRQSFAAWNHLVLTDARALAGRPETLLVVTPLSHTVAVMADVVLAAGGSLVIHERFEAGEVLAALSAERITRGYLAVPQLYRLLDAPRLARTDLSSVRQLVYSGSPAAPARMAAAVEVFGAALVQCYGSTEAGRITLLDQLDHFEPELLGSVGRPFPGVRIRVCDPLSGAELADGVDGEIEVRSPHVMTGYQDDVERTAAAFHDGWLRTGDLGHLDRYGYLRLVDRVGRAVKTDGVRVHPSQVEQALLTHPSVAECAVYGVRDADAIEQVHAAVVLRTPCDPEELRRHVTRHLSPQHAPTRITAWQELPLTDSGKPDLHRLRAEPVPV